MEFEITDRDRRIIDAVQVNIPFRMLYETHYDLFMRFNLNPEVGLDADALENFTVSEIRDIMQGFQRNNRSITIHGPFLDLSPGSPDPGIRSVTRQRFEQLLAVVAVVRPRSVVCHLGYEEDRYGYIKESWFDQSLSLWRWLGEELRKIGVILMLENVYEGDPAEMLPFFQNLQQHQVRFCLDVGHQAVFGKVSFSRWFDVLGAYIGQLHLHDNRGAKDEHLPMGKGTVDYTPLIHFLQTRKPFPIITLEPHEEPDLWTSLAYLKEVFHLLEIDGI